MQMCNSDATSPGKVDTRILFLSWYQGYEYESEGVLVSGIKLMSSVLKLSSFSYFSSFQFLKSKIKLVVVVLWLYTIDIQGKLIEVFIKIGAKISIYNGSVQHCSGPGIVYTGKKIKECPQNW